MLYRVKDDSENFFGTSYTEQGAAQYISFLGNLFPKKTFTMVKALPFWESVGMGNQMSTLQEYVPSPDGYEKSKNYFYISGLGVSADMLSWREPTPAEEKIVSAAKNGGGWNWGERAFVERFR